jgi:WD40 repeat protein
VARIGVQVAEALAYAHGEGVLHRDIKPGNLLLDARGNVWVADFGLAKTPDANDLTDAGAIVGTLRYLAPECFDGKADARTDVYALGLTLYELAALRPAFAENDRNRLIKQVTSEEPPRLKKLAPRLPRDLETIIRKAIHKDPARRFPTAQALADDLGRFLEDRPIRARRSGVLERTWRWCRRRPAAALLILVSLAALVSVGVLLTALAYNVKLAGALEDSEKLLYFNKITLAGREWWDCNIARADQLLAECPPPRRGWEWHFLKRNSHQEHHSLRTGATVVAYSHDGKLLASCGLDNALQLWDAHTGAPAGTRFSSPRDVRLCCLGFSPDGRFLAAGDTKGVVRIWDSSGKGLAELKLADLGCTCLAFDGSGSHIAVGGSSADPQKRASVVIWDTARWQMRHTLATEHSGAVAALAFNPTGRRLHVIGDTAPRPYDVGVVRQQYVAQCMTWDTDAGKPLDHIAWPTPGPVYAAFSTDCQLLATSTSDGVIRLWSRAEHKELRTFTGHTGHFLRLAFTPDGKRLASAGDDQSIRLWNVQGGHELAVLRGHGGSVWMVAFDSSGQWLASTSADGTVKTWDTGVFTVPWSPNALSDNARNMMLGPDGRWLLAQSGTPERTQSLWDARLKKAIITYPVFHHHTAAFLNVAMSADARWFAGEVQTPAADQPNAIKVWDCATGKEQCCIKDPDGRQRIAGPEFSPDGRLLAFFGGPMREKQLPAAVYLWDIAGDRLVWTHTRPPGVFANLLFSPDGNTVLALWARQSGSLVEWIVLLDAKTGGEIRALRANSLVGLPVVFAPSSRLIAATTQHCAIRLIDLTTGATVHSLVGHKSGLAALAFSPDGKRLASAGLDRTIKIWDTVSGQETLTLRGNWSVVTSVWFSADGHRLIACDQSGAVRTWDATPPPE